MIDSVDENSIEYMRWVSSIDTKMNKNLLKVPTSDLMSIFEEKKTVEHECKVTPTFQIS